MSCRQFFAVFFLLLGGNVGLRAQSQGKHTANMRLVEAYNERIIPGIPRAQVRTDLQIIIVWKSMHRPEAFYWYSNGDMLECTVARAYKNTDVNQHSRPSGKAYSTEDVQLADVQKGDTLLLTPAPGKEMALPAAAPKAVNNTIYCQAGSKWYTLSVKKIGTKNVNMP